MGNQLLLPSVIYLHFAFGHHVRKVLRPEEELVP